MADIHKLMGKMFGKPWYKEAAKKLVEIAGIPFMMSDDNEVVCIPDSPDQPVIGIYGRRGSGKSFIGHGIVDRAYWYGKKRLMIVNDILDETHFWSYPNDNNEQLYILRKLNETPKPLPCVYLYPSTDTLIRPSRPHLLTALPWREVIWNDSQFLELDKSAIYFRKFKKDFLKQKFKTWDDIENYLELQDMPENTFPKLVAIFRDIWDSKFTDINTDSVCKIEIGFPDQYLYDEEGKWYFNGKGKPKEYYVLNAFMAINTIPTFVTSDIADHEIFPNFMHFHLQNVFKNQTEDPFFKNNNIPVWAVCDEITTIAATDISNSKAAKLLTKYAKAGRPVRIGLVYATQNYTKIPKWIRSNTTYALCLSTLEEEANEIRKDFELEKHMKEEIINLGKHEIYALTKEKFLVYPTDGREEYTTSKPIRGVSLPPLSKHKSPTKNRGGT